MEPSSLYELSTKELRSMLHEVGAMVEKLGEMCNRVPGEDSLPLVEAMVDLAGFSTDIILALRERWE